jgi:Dolichyl-phosphate-mannose-protein mannosyltransferase
VLDVSTRAFRLGVAGWTALVALFLLARLTAWPPHEDEALALYVGGGSFGELIETVIHERGGAPLHFVVAWTVSHLGGGLGALRLVSAAAAVASVPLIARLAARLTDRTTALLATALASVSWVLLFHGIYARMYSIFLLTSLLSYLALLAALREGGTRRFALWAGAVLLCVATHPYGALVLASQGAYVLIVRERLREAFAACAAVVVLGTPFWISDLRLAGRFDVGVGGGGEQLGGPVEIVRYLGHVAGDFSAGPAAMPAAVLLAAFGFRELWARNRPGAWLAVAVVAVPTLAFGLARLGSAASPETRHLIFALPFFATLLALGLVAVARLPRPGAREAAGLTAALLLVGGVAWAWEKTPPLFTGDPGEREAGRKAAAAWLADTGSPSDVLLGYEPVFLDAWTRHDGFSRTVLPRADSKLAAEALRAAPKPLGRGVWVFDSYDTNNVVRSLTIARRFPRPADEFEARAFGPYLVVRTVEPTLTTDRYLEQAAKAQVLGRWLDIGDADVNFLTVSRTAKLLDYEPSKSGRSLSTSSR